MFVICPMRNAKVKEHHLVVKTQRLFCVPLQQKKQLSFRCVNEVVIL